MNKDWIGNRISAFSTMGAKNHFGERAELDYYATEPKATELLLKEELFCPFVWEPACGEGHISKVLTSQGYQVYSTDIADRGFGDLVVDFLQYEGTFDGDIITNPPYSKAKEFVLKALEIVPEGRKVAMFVKLTFLETKGRKQLFQDYPPETVYISSSRLHCWKNGNEEASKGSNAIAYCWIVWKKGFRGDTKIKWFN